MCVCVDYVRFRCVCELLYIKLQMKLCLAQQHQGRQGAWRANEPGNQKEKSRELVLDVMSLNPATHLYVFIQSLFCSCHTLTCRHQTFPSPSLHHRRSTLVSLYLNSCLTFHVCFASVNFCLLFSHAVVEVHVSAPQGAFRL